MVHYEHDFMDPDFSEVSPERLEPLNATFYRQRQMSVMMKRHCDKKVPSSLRLTW